jgi:hypothetical protein
VTDQWFSRDTLVSRATNKTDRHDITEILLKVTLSTINQNQISIKVSSLILKIPPPPPQKKKNPQKTFQISKKKKKKGAQD